LITLENQKTHLALPINDDCNEKSGVGLCWNANNPEVHISDTNSRGISKMGTAQARHPSMMHLATPERFAISVFKMVL
jgi:hypothetical protein